MESINVSHYFTSESRFAVQPNRNIPPPPYARGMGFAERLTQARKAKELSQEALGRLVDASKQTISSWENGRYEPNLEQIVKLCELLGCTADWLILNRSPESLPPDAIEQARFFNALSADGKKRWKTMRMVLADAASDATVEKKMPVTRRTAKA